MLCDCPFKTFVTTEPHSRTESTDSCRKQTVGQFDFPSVSTLSLECTFLPVPSISASVRTEGFSSNCVKSHNYTKVSNKVLQNVIVHKLSAADSEIISEASFLIEQNTEFNQMSEISKLEYFNFTRSKKTQCVDVDGKQTNPQTA